METANYANCCYRDGIEKSWNFSRFDNLVPANFVLAESRINHAKLKDDRPLVSLIIEEPNGFFSPVNLGYYDKIDKFSKILTVCPYSAEWFNAKFQCNKWQYVFMPFNADLIPAPQRKTIDCIYVGNIVSGELAQICKVLRDSCKFVNIAIHRKPGITTHSRVKYQEKLDLLSKSKIAIVHNVLFANNSHLQNAKRLYPDITKNVAFREAQKAPCLVPQLKSRIFESAFCRTLMFCRRDSWNLIEDWFTPNEDFLYFNNNHDLKEKVNEVLKNYDSYKHIVDSAFNKAMGEYSVKRFVEKYLVNLEV